MLIVCAPPARLPLFQNRPAAAPTPTSIPLTAATVTSPVVKTEPPEDFFSAFLEDGLFSDFEPTELAGDERQLLHRASGQFAFHSESKAPTSASRVSTPSSANDLDSPEVLSPFGGESAITGLSSASTSPPFANSDSFVMSSGAEGAAAGFEGLPQEPFDWRRGTRGGPFTVDGGGGGGGSGGGAAIGQQQGQQHPSLSTSDFVHSPFALALDSSLPPGVNPYFAALSSSYPTHPLPDWHNPAAHSYSGVPSPLLFQPHPSFPHNSSVPNSPGLNFFPAPQQPPFPGPDQSLLTLHMSLEAQAQTRLGGATSPLPPQRPSNVTAAVDRMQRASAAASGEPRPTAKRTSSTSSVKRGSAGRAPAHLRGKTHPSSANPPLPSPTTQLATPGASHHLFAQHFAEQQQAASPYGSSSSSTTSYQRPLPPLPRRTGTLPSSETSSGATSTATLVAPSPAYPPPRPSMHSRQSSSVAGPTPPASRPESPRLDYDFSSMEKDLDRFSSGGFASAAAAAMASVGPNRKHHKTVGAYGVGGYSSPASPYPEGTSPRVFHEVLSDNVYASLPPRSPAVSNGASPTGKVQTPGDSSAPSNLFDFDSFAAIADSPAAGSASPTGSTIIDEEAAEALSKKDPIAAQVWRMFNKAKNTLPNGARMENLTWRLMSMTLKKRKEETAAAAEAEALAASLLAAEVAEEELDSLQELGGRVKKSAGKGKERATEVETSEDGDGDGEARGRRGRNGTPKSSSSESPEGMGPEE